MATTKDSVDDHQGRSRLGILTQNDRVELIPGECVPRRRSELGPRVVSIDSSNSTSDG
jgi:hypothetical protein